MINRIFRLTGTQKIEVTLNELSIDSESVIVKPTYLSICAADTRYYFGRRKKEILRSKLPMALIHEGIGTVLFDSKAIYKPGDSVVMIPNIPGNELLYVRENYLPESKFMSSGVDGFMQDVLEMPHDRLLKLPNNKSVYVLCELLSVAYNALTEFEKVAHPRRKRIGIWGDGSVGFVTALALKYEYPDAEITVIGKHVNHLLYFTFVEKTYLNDELPLYEKFDHCFECVGGIGSEEAIRQIINHMLPEGSLGLMGVSENAVMIDTRTILDLGIVIYGNSRSGKKDFEKAIKLISENCDVEAYLMTIISNIVQVTDERDICDAFNKNEVNDFKTVMKWNV